MLVLIWLSSREHESAHKFAYANELLLSSSSTLENWCREFERFAPSIAIETYYGNKNDRPYLRDKLLRTQLGTDTKKGKNWEVLITTYNLAVGDSSDRKFFRRVPWNVRMYLVSLMHTAAHAPSF